jgi:hypothetical protein
MNSTKPPFKPATTVKQVHPKKKDKPLRPKKDILQEYYDSQVEAKKTVAKVNKPVSKEKLLHEYYHPKSGNRYEVLYDAD